MPEPRVLLFVGSLLITAAVFQLLMAAKTHSRIGGVLGHTALPEDISIDTREYSQHIQDSPNPVRQNSSYPKEPFISGTVPSGFLWGTSTAAYQVEGGWNTSGKGESIWDHWAHQPGRTPLGDTACDSYHKYATDVQLGANLAMTAYRFSISWPRLLPDGTLAGGVNQAGVDYYNKLIDELIAHKMVPFVTMYHWDLPQALQTKYGGWTNASMVDYFNDYATLCFQKFGDRVKRWATFNEPWSFIVPGYGLGVSPPQMLFGMKRRQYEVAHVVIKAHARAWHTYNDSFRAQQGGEVGIVLGALWGQPRNTSDPRDVQAADNFEQFFLGWFANPIYGNGDYPDAMKQMINGDSAADPRLPVFTEAEKAYVRGAADFVGLNQYSAVLIYASDHTFPLDFISLVMPDLKGVKDTSDPTWPHASYVVPWNIREQLRYFSEKYSHKVPFYITETGISEKEQFPPNMNDTWRQCFYMLYVDEAIRAIKLDGRDVRGFFAWTLMDNIEWGSGHSVRLGLHYTNFSDPNLTRTPKASAKLYRDIATSGGFPEGAPHTKHTQDWWDWCHTNAPYNNNTETGAGHYRGPH
ncbi:LCT [Branchiostoma lanceolatum]|uniref:LCT protein n=1 Tax=Branchiostoma lanceolatum TaxID=7740 RepID=A0A8K0AFU0_BRALA|nr:LCT [Branchiostoma lanceolatum]